MNNNIVILEQLLSGWSFLVLLDTFMTTSPKELMALAGGYTEYEEQGNKIKIGSQKAETTAKLIYTPSTVHLLLVLDTKRLP